MKIKYLIASIIVTSIVMTACKKFVEADSPVAASDGRKIYDKDVTAIGVVTNIYQKMSGGNYLQGKYGIAILTGLSSDELIGYPGIEDVYTQAYRNQLTSDVYNLPFWDNLYNLIYTVNTAIQGIEKSMSLNSVTKQRLLGEAKFLRAYFYFYLVNIWGDVPLPLDNDYAKNRLLPRSPVQKVYEQILKDLEGAEQLLDDRYLLSDLKTESIERIRPNKWVVKALLARVSLYLGNYAKAEGYASSLINGTSLFKLEDISKVFLKTSKESIWQIQSIDRVFNTLEAKVFYLTGQPNYFTPVSLSDNLMTNFEKDDKRQIAWTKTENFEGKDYSFPIKYVNIAENADKTEDFIVFRLAEQYLIRSEARAKLGNLYGAKEDLNVIRHRAGVGDTPADDEQSILRAVEDERRVELFTEAGHRWLDLKRTKRVDAVMTGIISSKGGGQWNSNKSLYPLPSEEVLRNPNTTQNPGY